MIAIDTSALISFLEGKEDKISILTGSAIGEKRAVFPPVVLTDILSEPSLSKELREILNNIPLLRVRADFWKNAGLLRAKILSKGLRARVADALIAQSCIDEDLTLLTQDRDFNHFEKYGGLKLLR